ncbi:MAG: hypothetical protein ACOX7M_06335 [Dysosmobacter sp.]|jgi:hypothetical protein|uniref:hypothetical protein n=1 Tax=Dysosmobacter sp. TaxID=2591382 RepID=UPI003D8C96BA
MDYKEQIAYLRYLEQQSQHIEASAFARAARSITDLLARAEAAEARAEKAEKQRDEYFKHLQGLCFCCAHRTDGFDCHVKCYGHKRGSAWVYAGPEKEE